MTLKSPNAALLLAAAATALATLGSVVAPLVVVAAVGATAVGYVAAKAPVRYLLAALLAYIPAEPTILTYAPAGAGGALRFGPEALVDFVVLWRVLPHVIAGRRQLRPLALPSLGVLVLWTASVAWNGTGVTTALIGVHSEFRFAVVALAVMVSAAPVRDGRLYARTAMVAGCLEAGILLLEYLGGAPVRHLFATSYDITIGGLAATGAQSTQVFGTFPDYNSFGAFVTYAFLVVAAAASPGVRLRSWTVAFALAAMAAAVTLSGSRESLIALTIGYAVILYVGNHVPGAAIVLVAAVIGMVVVLAFGHGGNLSQAEQTNANIGSISRLRALTSPAALSSNPNDPRSNFRLYLLRSNMDLVARTSPILGFGLGTVSDPRPVANGTSPLYRTAAGREAVAFHYARDGNWALLALEVGFGGLAVLGLLFVALGRVAARLVDTDWCGAALLALLTATLILGFFEPILQLQGPAFVFALVVGLTLNGKLNGGETAS